MTDPITTGHLADLHIREKVPRTSMPLSEQAEVLQWIADDGAERGVDLWLVAGDIYDGESTIAERLVAAEFFQSLAHSAPVVAVQGNHERDKDIDILGKLEGQHRIEVRGVPDAIHLGEWGASDFLGEAVVACLPWPRKAMLYAAHNKLAWAAKDTGELDEVDRLNQLDAEAMLRAGMTATLALIRDAFDRAPPDAPRILLAHCELGAAITDAGQPMTGRCDVELNAGELLDTGLDYGALGHVHQYQGLHGTGETLAAQRICSPLVYPGAAWPNTFAEIGTKGYVVARIAHNEVPEVEHIATPGRKLVTVDLGWEVDNLGTIDDANAIVFREAVVREGFDNHAGSMSVRLRYEVGSENRHTAAKVARAYAEEIEAAGHPVKIDAKVTTATASREASVEVARAHSLPDKLEAYWAAKCERPARAEAILEKAKQLEEVGDAQ